MENIRFLPMVGLGIHKTSDFLKPNHHHIHSSYEKSTIERTIQYIKERTERFDDYFPCRKDNDWKLKVRHEWVEFICRYEQYERLWKRLLSEHP